MKHPHCLSWSVAACVALAFAAPAFAQELQSLETAEQSSVSLPQKARTSDSTYIVRRGVTLEGNYLVERIEPPTLILKYLPLNQLQSLAIGE